MKRLSFLLVNALMLMPLTLSAQVAISPYKGHTLERCSDQKEIQVDHSYQFDNDWSGIQNISPDGENFIVWYKKHKLSDVGQYISYESATGRELFHEKKVESRNFIPIEKGLLSLGLDNIKLINPKTGEVLWEKDEFYEKPFFLHDNMLLTLGKLPNNQDKEYVFCYYVGRNRRHWALDIPHSDGISTICPIDSDNVFIVSNDLTKLNLKTGAKKTMKIKNSIVDGAGVAKGLLGALALVSLPVFTGYVVVPIYVDRVPTDGMLYKVKSDGSTITDLTSNLLRDKDLFYLADRKEVRCFDADLNIKWSTALPPKKAAHSHLFLQGDTLWMVSSGTGTVKGTQTSSIDDPFVAAFKASTGEQLLLTMMGDSNDNICKVKKQDHRTLFSFKNSFKVYDFGTQQVATYDLKEKDYQLLTDSAYVYEPRRQTFSKIDHSQGIYFVNKDGDLFQLSDQGTPEPISPARKVYYSQGEMTDGTMALVNMLNEKEGDCWVVNPDGTSLCHVITPLTALSVRGKYLFLHSGSVFSVVSKETMLAPVEQ